jgi:hypothetical protein
LPLDEVIVPPDVIVPPTASESSVPTEVSELEVTVEPRPVRVTTLAPPIVTAPPDEVRARLPLDEVMPPPTVRELRVPTEVSELEVMPEPSDDAVSAVDPPMVTEAPDAVRARLPLDEVMPPPTVRELRVPTEVSELEVTVDPSTVRDRAVAPPMDTEASDDVRARPPLDEVMVPPTLKDARVPIEVSELEVTPDPRPVALRTVASPILYTWSLSSARSPLTMVSPPDMVPLYTQQKKMLHLELVVFWTVAWAHGLNDVTGLSGLGDYLLYTLASAGLLMLTINTPKACRMILLGGASLATDHYALGHVEMIALTALPRRHAKRVFRLFFVMSHALPRIVAAASVLPPLVTWPWLLASVPAGVMIAGLDDSTRECIFVSLAIPHIVTAAVRP